MGYRCVCCLCRLCVVCIWKLCWRALAHKMQVEWRIYSFGNNIAGCAGCCCCAPIVCVGSDQCTKHKTDVRINFPLICNKRPVERGDQTKRSTRIARTADNKRARNYYSCAHTPNANTTHTQIVYHWKRLKRLNWVYPENVSYTFIQNESCGVALHLSSYCSVAQSISTGHFNDAERTIFICCELKFPLKTHFET